jgi:hypothetical protein
MREIFGGRLGAVAFEGSWKSALMEMNASEIGLGVLIFVVALVASLGAVGFILTRLPHDYFACKNVVFWADRPAWQRTTAHVGKNLVGVVLIVVGVLLSVPGVPGQGLITILIGIILVDFPGKRRLEARIMRMPRIFAACNKVRVRFRRAPFLAPIQPGTSKRCSSPGE